MSDITQSTFTVILSVEFIIGNLGNGFIALVNCVDWVKRRKISPVDRILTALAISRIGMLWLVLLTWWMSMFYPDLLMSRDMLRIIYIPLKVSSHLSSWLSTCLIIFYFLKIANFSNSVFLYLKWRVKKVVSLTLMMSLTLLFLNIVLMYTHSDIWMDGSKGNVSNSSSLWKVAEFSKHFLFNSTMFTFVPFTVSLIAFLLLIFSLWRHLKTMQHSAPGCRDASTTAHVKALQTVVAFLLLYAIFFLWVLVKLWTYNLVEKSPILLFIWTSGITFSSAHSCVLILGDSKLRQASLLVLLWLKGRSKDAGPWGP